MYFGNSTDISSPRKPSVVKIYCGNKPAVGCVRKPRLQATWFMKLRPGGQYTRSLGNYGDSIYCCDFSLPSVVAEEAVTLYCN